jgi:transposase InsO family protein
MDKENKKRIAEFRFGVIADLIGHRKLNWGEHGRLLKEKASQHWEIPFSSRTTISSATILGWIRRYKRSGRKLSSLYPAQRCDKGSFRSLDSETVQTLINLKQEYKKASVPGIIRKAKVRKLLPSDFKVTTATLYRLFREKGLMDKQISAEDRRRYEAELANEIWQSDCLHGPKVDVKGKLRKSYLFAFIDDCSRLIPHAEFYLSERVDTFCDALRKALRKRGLPQKLYLDNAPGFRSHHLANITASLGIALVHSRPYKPEGKGKIERWFKTIRSQLLSVVDQETSLKELNQVLWDWIDNDYHQRIHSSTKEAPLARYLKHIHLIREAPKDMEDYFRKRLTRLVHKDRTVSLNGRFFEAPTGLIGKIVTHLFHEHDTVRVEVLLNDTSFGFLVPLDLHINCRIRRDNHTTKIIPKDKNTQPPEDPDFYKNGQLFGPGDSDDEL